MKSLKKLTVARRARSTSKLVDAAHDLTPSRSTLIAFHKNARESRSLYESASGQYFVHSQDNGDENVTLISAAAAGVILSHETQRHMAKIFRRKLEAPAKATINGINLDTSKDSVVWSQSDDDVEAAAVYRTKEGIEYLRVVNPWRDSLMMFGDGEIGDVTAPLSEWLCCDRSFFTHVDHQHDLDVSFMGDEVVNEASHDFTPWRLGN